MQHQLCSFRLLGILPISTLGSHLHMAACRETRIPAATSLGSGGLFDQVISRGQDLRGKQRQGRRAALEHRNTTGSAEFPGNWILGCLGFPGSPAQDRRLGCITRTEILIIAGSELARDLLQQVNLWQSC